MWWLSRRDSTNLASLAASVTTSSSGSRILLLLTFRSSSQLTQVDVLPSPQQLVDQGRERCERLLVRLEQCYAWAWCDSMARTTAD